LPDVQDLTNSHASDTQAAPGAVGGAGGNAAQTLPSAAVNPNATQGLHVYNSLGLTFSKVLHSALSSVAVF